MKKRIVAWMLLMAMLVVNSGIAYAGEEGETVDSVEIEEGENANEVELEETEDEGEIIDGEEEAEEETGGEVIGEDDGSQVEETVEEDGEEEIAAKEENLELYSGNEGQENTVVSLGDQHTASVTMDGDLYCWGWNDSGQVGNGTKKNRITPVKVLSNVKTVSLGGSHSAAVTMSGNLYCWGNNLGGQVGNGITEDQTTPVKILSNVKTVSLRGGRTAAVTTDGDLYCWGGNTSGQVGNGTRENQTTPVKILSNVKTVSLGSYHSAVVTMDGDLYCWGDNDAGQVGNGTKENQTTPVKILSNVKTVSLGRYHSAAVTTNGDLYSWGSNFSGEVGNGTREDQTTPVKILSNVKAVSLGYAHSAAVTMNGDLYCWGDNYHGEVGNGTKANQTVPVKILSNVKTVSLGAGYSAAVTTNGDLYCWGENYYGEVGNGTKESQTTPIKILSNVKTVLSETGHSAAVTTNGDLYCWGNNSYGQAGNGTTTDQLTPVKVLENIQADGGEDDSNSITTVTKIPGAINHYYGVNSYKNTPEGEIYDDAVAFVKAMDNYLVELRKATRKDSQTLNSSSKSYAKMLKEADAATSNRIIKMDATTPEEALDSVYETLAQYLDMYVETGMSLGKIDMSASTIEISAGIINKIRNNMESINFIRKEGKYTVSFRVFKFMFAYFGNVTVQGNGHTYKGTIISSDGETAKALQTYINDMSGWAKDALYQSLKSIFTELGEITGIADYTKKEIKSFLKDKVDLLQSRGYGKVLQYWTAMRDGYDICQDIVAAKDASSLTNALGKAENIYKKLKNLDYSDSTVSNKIVEAAMNKLNSAKDRLEQSLYDYLYDSDSSKDEDNWWNTFKSIFIQCPVDFVVYDNSGKELGRVEGTIATFSSDIKIMVDGDVKTLIIPEGIDARIEFTGTDSGDMTYVIEQTVKGEVTGRANYYDVPLSDGGKYSQTVSGKNLTENNAAALVSDNNSYNMNEYISASDEDAHVTISVDTGEGGTVVGAGDYATGSPVVLCAYPENESSKFVGWYIGDVLVEKNSVYRFAAKNDVSIKAMFDNNYQIDEAYSSIISKEYEESTDILIYKSLDKGNDIIISTAGLEDLEELNVTLKTYDKKGNPVENVKKKTQYDGVYRFTISSIDLSSFSKVEIFDDKDQLIGTIVRSETYTLGDINNDGDITMTDLMMCLHHVSGRSTLTDNALLAADIDGDGAVKMIDLMRILHYVSGRNNSL